MKVPKLGLRVGLRSPLHDDTKYGVVIELLSKQFVYIDEEEHVHYALYTDDWFPAES